MAVSGPETINVNATGASNRNWARYPADRVPVQVTAGKVQFQAVAIDESIGGLGMETEQSVPVFPGQVVELELRDTLSHGRITAVIPNSKGGCRISIRWEEDQSDVDDGERVPFLEFGTVAVVCQVTPGDIGASQNITLWDGKQFEVAADQLAYRTRQSRQSELKTMGQRRDVVARMYDIPTHSNPDRVVDRILEFEFGSSQG